MSGGQRGTYVALSYCWGTSQKNVLLTRATVKRFQTIGLDVAQLPQTIQDAILVTRNLGVRYIWIDALCIIQNEPELENFKLEAPKMGEYYSNAYVTLAAGSATDCAEGFLNDRPHPEAAPCALQYSEPNAAGLTESVIREDGLVYICAPPYKGIGTTGQTSTGSGPIMKRAWVTSFLYTNQSFSFFR